MSPGCLLFKSPAPAVPLFTFSGVPPLVAKATTGNHDAANPQWRVTIPTTAQPGDLAIVSVSAINLGGATHTTPAGWTLLDSGTATSGFNNTARLYSKVLVAGDIGVMIQFGSSTDKWSTSVRVYRNAAIDTFAKAVLNSSGAAFTQVSATATRSRGVNVQIITGTGNQTWTVPTRSHRTSHFHYVLQFGAPAFSGQASQDREYTSAGPTGTAGGIIGTPNGASMAVVQWNVLLYNTALISHPLEDTYDRANATDGIGTASDFKRAWYERSLENVPQNVWGINTNEAYVPSNNSSGLISYFDAGTPDVTASVLVTVMPTGGDQGLAVRYNPADDSRIDVRVNSLGQIITRVINGSGISTTLGTLASGTIAIGGRLGCVTVGTTVQITVNAVVVATYIIEQNVVIGRYHGVSSSGTGATNVRLNNYNLVGTAPVGGGYFTEDFSSTSLSPVWEEYGNDYDINTAGQLHQTSILGGSFDGVWRGIIREASLGVLEGDFSFTVTAPNNSNPSFYVTYLSSSTTVRGIRYGVGAAKNVYTFTGTPGVGATTDVNTGVTTFIDVLGTTNVLVKLRKTGPGSTAGHFNWAVEIFLNGVKQGATRTYTNLAPTNTKLGVGWSGGALDRTFLVDNIVWQPPASITDTFNRTYDGTTLDGETTSDGQLVWQTHVGTPNINTITNAAQKNASGDSSFVLATNMPNVEVKATLLTPDLRAGLIVRAIDINNYWRFHKDLTTNTVQIMRVLAGVTTSTTHNVPAAGSTVELKVVAFGSVIRFYYGGELIRTDVSGANQYGTRHGIYAESNNARLDDFVVTPLATGPNIPIGYNGPYSSGFASEGAQQVTPTVSKVVNKVLVWGQFTGSRRVGFTTVKPGTVTPGSIPWLGFADIVGSSQQVWLEANLSTPVNFVSGTPIWAVSVNNGGSGDIACGTSALPADFVQCTISSTAWYGATFASSLANFYLMIQGVP